MSHLINPQVQTNLVKHEALINQAGLVALLILDMVMIPRVQFQEAHRILIGQICQKVKIPTEKLSLPNQECLLECPRRSKIWVPCF
jgi:hypothetical protein